MSSPSLVSGCPEKFGVRGKQPSASLARSPACQRASRGCVSSLIALPDAALVEGLGSAPSHFLLVFWAVTSVSTSDLLS